MSEVMEKMPATQAATVAVIDPSGAFVPGKIRELVTRIQADARAQAAVLDISDEKGRKAIASLAHKVARSKTAIDEAGKALNESKRAEIAVVDADRRWARETLDALKVEVRKQLTDWEQADEDRIAAHKAALAVIQGAVTSLPPDASTEHISGLIATLRTNQPRDWQEFAAPAGKAIADAVTGLQAAWDAAFERECNAAAERERKAREAEEKKRAAAQAQREREAQIAADAAREAEEKAAQAEAARLAAVTRLAEVEAQAEADRAAAAEQARLDQIERDRIAIERAEINRIADLAKAERERQTGADEQQRSEAQDRADSPSHRKTVEIAAAGALMAAGLSRGAALTAVRAVAAGSIPNVVINY